MMGWAISSPLLYYTKGCECMNFHLWADIRYIHQENLTLQPNTGKTQIECAI